jgi:hypothetical protein
MIEMKDIEITAEDNVSPSSPGSLTKKEKELSAFQNLVRLCTIGWLTAPIGNHYKIFTVRPSWNGTSAPKIKQLLGKPKFDNDGLCFHSIRGTPVNLFNFVVHC